MRGPGPPRFHDFRGDAELVVELLDLGIGDCGLADAQASAVTGWQHHSADLVCLEGLADSFPRRMDGPYPAAFFRSRSGGDRPTHKEKCAPPPGARGDGK